MLSCKTFYKKKMTEERFSFWERLQLPLHLLLCGKCANFLKQLKFFNHRIKVIENERAKQNPGEVKELEKKIKKSLIK